jgi:dephospho-CoA kinase
MPVLTVALTGGIATGKSVVARVLKRRGCFVESADLAARGLMSPGRPAWKQVAAHFGPTVLNPDRTINRPRLASIIFSNEAERRFLDSVVHPLVMAEKQRTVRRLEKPGRRRIYVSEAALTLEAGFAGFFDRIIVTDCPVALQVRRLMERDGLERPDALRRVHAQLPRAARLRRADYVIDTSGTMQRTVQQAEEVAARLGEDCRRKRDAGNAKGGSDGPRLRTGARRPKAGP